MSIEQDEVGIESRVETASGRNVSFRLPRARDGQRTGRKAELPLFLSIPHDLLDPQLCLSFELAV